MAADPRETSRRELLIAAGACAIAAGHASRALAQLPGAETATTPPAPSPPPWLTAVRAITGDAPVGEAKVAFEVPEIAENGNVIPFVATVESPMTDAHFVRSLRLFSTANPLPLIATFRFSPESGKAQVASRFRLAKSQDVVALAEMSDGAFYMAKRAIKVTIGGCGG